MRNPPRLSWSAARDEVSGALPPLPDSAYPPGAVPLDEGPASWRRDAVTVPDETVTAAIEALMKRSAQAIGSQGMAAARWHAVVALEAAEPAIRAAVYAEVRQLAIGHSNTPTWAAVISGDKALRQFADLITRPQPARGGTAAARHRAPSGGTT